jgi:outer membrane receptor protein involved in Fe transport
MLRASFGEGFLPPNVNQLSPTFLPQLDFSTFQTDPLRGNEPLGLVDFTGGGNPALQPEKSRSLSAGIVLTPRFVPNLRFSADWTRINKTDAIVVGGLYQLIPSNFATFLQVAPQRVTRNTNPATFGIYGVGPITAIDDSNINVSTQRVRAYDFSLEYRVDAGRAGAFTFTSTATHLKMNAIRVIPTADEQENAGTRAALQWRAAGTVGWSYNAWSANWSTRFFDKYCMVSGCVVQLNQGSASIPSQVYHDIFIDFAPDKEVTPWGSKVELQFGINNIFDRDPPIDTDNTSQYYSTFGDPRGSNYYAAIKLTW